MTGFIGCLYQKQHTSLNEVKMDQLFSESQYEIQSEETIESKHYSGKLFRNCAKTFANDRVFERTASELKLFDGVLLNKKQLIDKCAVQQYETLFSVDCLADTISQFRGSFAGVSWDKEQEKMMIFNDHVGDKPIFYFYEKSIFFFGTDIYLLLKLIQQSSDTISFKINRNGAYALLTHGHTLCNETLFEGVQRLTPGHYLMFSKLGLTEHQYFFFDNEPRLISEQAAVEELDRLFRIAVKRAFEKDREYGYRHLVALSGGLDSRMVAWVANRLGYHRVVNYTFSQTAYYDEIVAKEIASKLKNQWLFKSLDNGLYLMDSFAESVYLANGTAQSAGIAHTLSMLNSLNLSTFGLVHTGQLGDVIIGTYFNRGKRKAFMPGDGAVSQKLVEKLNYSSKTAFTIENQEMFKFYNRGFSGINAGLAPMLKYTETISPFLDVDFFTYCLSLPLEFRKGHRIYLKWIREYYPEAADFVYEKVGGKIKFRTFEIKGVPVPWTSVPKAIVKAIRMTFGKQLKTKRHMNPFDYWYQSNPDLKIFYQKIYSDNIDLMDDKQLKDDCAALFHEGNALEKNLVISLLYSWKLALAMSEEQIANESHGTSI